MNYSKEQNTSLIMYKFSSPSKPKPNMGDISTNEYEGLTTAEQCDQLYLNNMNISKLQNSNCTGSGSFAPINNVSICSFRVNEDDDINQNDCRYSYFTLKDLNVTPVDYKKRDKDDLSSTPISTMCNYYLHSESNTKSVRKKKDVVNSIFDKNTSKENSANKTNQENSNRSSNKGSDTKKNVEKCLTLNKKIDFYNNNNNTTTKTKNNNNKDSIINSNRNNINETKKHLKGSTTINLSNYNIHSRKNCNNNATVKKIIQLELFNDKDNPKPKEKPKAKSSSVTRNKKNASLTKGTITKQSAIETIKKIYHSLNKKATSSSVKKKKDEKKPIKDLIKSIKHISLSKEKKSKSKSKSQHKAKNIMKTHITQNKKESYNNIHNIKIQICHTNNANNTINTNYTPITTTINLSTETSKKLNKTSKNFYTRNISSHGKNDSKSKSNSKQKTTYTTNSKPKTKNTQISLINTNGKNYPCYSTVKKQTSFISQYKKKTNSLTKNRPTLTIMTTKQHQNLTMNITKRQPSPSINSLTNQSTRTYTMTSQSSRPYQTESSEKIKIKQNCSKVKGQIISVKRTSSALRERTNSTKKKF